MLAPMREPGTLRYGPDYAEERTLADGTRVKLRLAQPSDREAFRQALEAPESSPL